MHVGKSHDHLNILNLGLNRFWNQPLKMKSLLKKFVLVKPVTWMQIGPCHHVALSPVWEIHAACSRSSLILSYISNSLSSASRPPYGVVYEASLLCDLNAYSFISRLWHIYHVLLSGKVPLGWSGQHGRARRWCSVTDETHSSCGGSVATQGLSTDLK